MKKLFSHTCFLRHVGSIMGTALILAALASCQSPKGNKTATSEPNVKSNKDLSQVRVGYCTPSLNAPFYVALSKAVETSTKSYGMKFVSVDGQGDITKQITGVEDLISKGVNILIINPLDPKALVPTVNAASKAGIPVFIVDSYIEPEANYVTSVLADNQLNGELLGAWVSKKLNGAKINMALISGAQGNPVGKEKRMGFVRGVINQELTSQGTADLKVAAQGWGNWTISGGLKAMEDILVAHPDINVLVAENDAMALGAMKAIGESGKGKNIVVVGFDGQKDALERITQGTMGATARNSPAELGKLVVQSVVKYLNGDKHLSRVSHTESVLITADNAKQYFDPKSIF